MNDGNAFLASEVSLSCIEEYFLSQIYRKKEQKYLFFESSISVQRIWQDQMINKNGFANVKCVERIHDLAKQRKLIDFCYAENTSIDYNADYIAVEVKNARSMRNDHYILVKSINDSQVYSFDTLSNQEGVCTKEKIKRLRQTRTIHFYYIEQEAQSTWIYDSQEKFWKTLRQSTEKRICLEKEKLTDMQAVRDFLLVLQKMRKRCLYYMFETVEDDYTNWLKMQIRNIEYQRLRKIEMSEEIYTLLQETVIYDFEWMRRMSKCMKKL